MSAADIASDSPAAPVEAAPAALRRTQPFLWSLRRELWENASLWIAPAAIAGIVLVGMAIGATHIPANVARLVAIMPPAKRAEALALPMEFVSFVILAATLVTTFFYCLGALHGERRDRSILFWKSLPVSDLTAVLAKAAVPLVVAPAIAFVVTVLAILAILLASLAILPALSLPPTLAWSDAKLPSLALGLAYLLAATSLWYAPVWGWLLFISGWARRAPILWALGPPFGLTVFELVALGTHHVGDTLHDRLLGLPGHAFGGAVSHNGHFDVNLDLLDPQKLASTPGLWIGLVVAAALIAATAWQRRWRTPL